MGGVDQDREVGHRVAKRAGEVHPSPAVTAVFGGMTGPFEALVWMSAGRTIRVEKPP